jgi:hypothetical protein
MPKTLFALVVAALAAFPCASASAQPSGASQPGEPEASTESPSPNITVKEDRLVCRRRERTGTRMGTSRVCRTQAEWNQAERDRARDSEETSDTLDVLGADDISTGDVGDALDRANDTPLGPR